MPPGVPRCHDGPMDPVAAFAVLAAEVVDTIPWCDLGSRVPACPGWTSYDVVVHLGNVHGRTATTLETGERPPEQHDEPASRRSRAVASWYAAKAEDLLAVLRTVDPAGYWPRRQTHETLVHLVDLQQAAGRTARLPKRLGDDAESWAADGVAEVLEVFVPRMHARGRPAILAAPLLLSASDTGDTWLVRPPDALEPDGPPVSRRVDGEDLVDGGIDLVAGPALDLMLLLWKRLPVDAPTVTLDGDLARLRAFLASPLTP